MFDFCVEHIPGIKFFKVLDEDVIQHERTIASRSETAITVQGTQQFHRLVPISQSQLHAYKISNQDETPKLVSVTKVEQNEIAELEVNEQNYVFCSYENDFYIGLITKKSEEHGDYFIQFMTPMYPSRQYYWPKPEDTCWVPKQNIKCILSVPSTNSSSKEDSDKIGHFLESIAILLS